MPNSEYIQEWPLDKLTVDDIDYLMVALIMHYDDIMVGYTSKDGRNHFRRAYDKLHAAALNAKGEPFPALRPPEE